MSLWSRRRSPFPLPQAEDPGSRLPARRGWPRAKARGQLERAYACRTCPQGVTQHPENGQLLGFDGLRPDGQDGEDTEPGMIRPRFHGHHAVDPGHPLLPFYRARPCGRPLAQGRGSAGWLNHGFFRIDSHHAPRYKSAISRTGGGGVFAETPGGTSRPLEPSSAKPIIDGL